MAQRVTETADKLADAFKVALQAVPFGTIFAPAVSAFQKALSAVTSSQKDSSTLAASGGAVAGNIAAISENTSALKALTAVLAAQSGPSTGGGVTGAPGGSPASAAQIEGLKKIKAPQLNTDVTSGSMGSKAAGIAGALGPIAAAAAAAAAAIVGLVEAAKSFAGLISPASLTEFNRAMSDLQATVGVALLPVLQTATDVLRDWGQTLLPIMQQFAPIMAQLAQIVGQNAIAEFKMLADLLKTLRPVFEAVGAVLAAFSEVFKAVMSILQVVFLVLSPIIYVVTQALKILASVIQLVVGVLADWMEILVAFGKAVGQVIADGLGIGDAAGGVKSAMDYLRTGFRELIKIVVAVGVSFMRMMGMNKLVSAFADKLKGEKANNEGLRPAEGAQFQDMKSYGQEIAKRAAVAGMGKSNKTSEDWLSDIANMIKDGKEGDYLKEIKDYIMNGRLAEDLANAMGKGTQSAVYGKLPFVDKDKNGQNQMNWRKFLIGF